MLGYLLKRLAVACGLVLAAVTLVFLMIHMVPGDPAQFLLSQGSSAPSPEAVAALRQQLGLDRPLIEQYLRFLAGLVAGDFGNSMRDGHAVAAEIWLRLPRTLELILVAGLMAMAAGIPTGAWAALHPAHWLARGFSLVSGLALAIPVFVSGTLLVLAFALKLPVLPSGGFVPIGVDPVAHFRHLLLPSVTVAIGLAAMVFQMTFSAVSEIKRQEFVLAARARGIPQASIARRHILPNAMIPVVTLLALQLGTLLGGTVLVETVALVGESGSGKTLTSLSIMGLLPETMAVTGGRIAFRNRKGESFDTSSMTEEELQALRGRDIGLVLQDPSVSLNPVRTVGDQFVEAILVHQPIGAAAAKARAIELLRRVGLPDPERKFDSYPHEMSGGQRQRVSIAIANRPRLLIADEPTTALDVVVQKQIVKLLGELMGGSDGMGMIFVTHNLGLVAEMADRVVIMYRGDIVEQGMTKDVFARPAHDYTRSLLGSLPVTEKKSATNSPEVQA